MPRIRYTEAEESWLRENYPNGTINDTIDAFEREFGRRLVPRALYVKANNMGLRKKKHENERYVPAQKAMHWSRDKFKREREWMLENDKTCSVFETIDAFEKEFGVRLTRSQVSLFRSTYGTQRRASKGGGKPPAPVGTERISKGYVFMKVAENPTRPQSKNNWKMKHVHVWEQHNGPLPKGWIVLFADRDTRNFDPDNLVAVSRKHICRLNERFDWHDRETLEAAINCVKLEHAIVDARNRPRECGVCGKTFTPQGENRYQKARTCPECLANGRKSKATYGKAGEAQCAVCGKTFTRDRKNQRRCRECIAEKPRHGVDVHAAQRKAKG
jgi:hypothetical protein